MYIKTLSTALALSVLTACQPTTPPQEKTQAEKPAPVETKVEHFTVNEQMIKIGDQHIYGKLYKPSNAPQKMPIIIYSHGLGGTHTSLEEYAKILAEKGIAGYVFDFRGGSHESKSSGDTTQMTVLTEVQDLKDIIAEVQKWDFVDTNKIILMGESQGGLVSALTAGEIPQQIAGLIEFFPAFVMQDDAHKKAPDIQNITDESVSNYFPHIKIGKQYVLDAYNLNAYDKIATFDKPMLLLHGDQDTVVPMSYSDFAAKIYPKAEYHVIAGAGHGFKETSYFNQSLAFVEKYLQENQLDK